MQTQAMLLMSLTRPHPRKGTCLSQHIAIGFHMVSVFVYICFIVFYSAVQCHLSLLETHFLKIALCFRRPITKQIKIQSQGTRHCTFFFVATFVGYRHVVPSSSFSNYYIVFNETGVPNEVTSSVSQL